MEEKDEEVATAILTRNADLVEKFLAIAESKVSIRDEYGDENWEALPDEIQLCLKKIANREHLSVDWKRFDPQIARHLRQSSPLIGKKKLEGIIVRYGEDFVILKVNDVDYEVLCSGRTLQELPRAGEPTTLAIEAHLHEDPIRVFGFSTDVEREWFRLLQTVQGVGGRVALAVLGTLRPAELAAAIAMRDRAMVARTPGVGPRVAGRIVSELQDKAHAYVDPSLVRLSGALNEKRAPAPVSDAVTALVNLGYAQPQAAAAIAAVVRDGGEVNDVRGLIRLGLKELAK